MITGRLSACEHVTQNMGVNATTEKILKIAEIGRAEVEAVSIFPQNP
jgi:hypothetical protein